MRVLVAPDKFRGTLTAGQVAAAVAAGWRRARPDDEVEEIPLADGGDGTLDVLVAGLGGELRPVRVTGPLGDPLEAEFGLVSSAHGERSAVVETAKASGLSLIPESRRDPLGASTFGTGELILAACGERPDRVVVAVGGSASNDGGAGMAQALGVRLLGAGGREVAPGGAALLDLDRVDASGLSAVVRGIEFVIASDVDNPLLGPNGASAVYGPQKGASPKDVQLLERALARFADVVARDLRVEVRDRPGAGAAGGLGFGLMAFLGAEVRSGVELVMEAVGFAERLARTDLVITGEGKFDEQSLRGKTPAGVKRAADRAGVRVAIVCGRAEIEPEGATVASLVEAFGEERALRDTAAALEELAERLARELSP